MAQIEALDLTEARYDLLKQPVEKKREIVMPSDLMKLAGAGGFKAAQFNRLTADWRAIILSADQDLWSDLRRMRARSRWLFKNNQYARKFVRMCQKNIIGAQGITFQAKVKKQRGDGLLDSINQELKRAWNDWSRRENCDAAGKMSWQQMQIHAAGQLAIDGEVIMQKVPMPDSPHFYALKFIDPDQLDHTFMVERLPNGNEIRLGVEVDPNQRPVAYHLWTKHPSEYTDVPKMRIRVPADQIIHLYISERVNQTRGVPWAFASMWEMNMLGGYKEAEVTASRMGAAKSLFFKSDKGEEYTGDGDLSAQVQAPVADFSPGMVETLPPGLEPVLIDPTHPNQNYDKFVKESLRGIASGLDVAYHALGNDLENVNFSSIRAGTLDERETWKMLQQFFIDGYHRQVYEGWMPNAILGGALKLPASGLDQYRDGACWHGRGWDWVDPLKDVQASVLGIQNGLTTITRELAQQGLDIEEILTERKEEVARIEELGLTIGTDKSGVADTAADDNSDPDSPGGDPADAAGEVGDGSTGKPAKPQAQKPGKPAKPQPTKPVKPAK